MFHIQATSQKTLVFTPMLIKVNYFVVLGHWYKTCALFSLCNVQKFKISRCIQDKLMTYLCFSVWFKAFFFFLFSLCLNYSASLCQMLSWFLWDSFSLFFCYPFTFTMVQFIFFSSWAISWIIIYSKRKSDPWAISITNESSHLKL